MSCWCLHVQSIEMEFMEGSGRLVIVRLALVLVYMKNKIAGMSP